METSLTNPTITETATYVSQLTLQDFRNYRWCQLKVEAAPVVLVGHNGAGKTNILEALSLLIPGKGCRSSALGDMARLDSGKASPWAIGAAWNGQAGECIVGTNLTGGEEGSGSRRFLLDGEEVKSRTVLNHLLGILWLTPDMDGLLRDATSIRRRFLDKLVTSFDGHHSSHLNQYEQAMRERNKLLSFPRPDGQWLSAIERKMAETASMVAAARLRFVELWQASIDAGGQGFPQAALNLQGQVEEDLRNYSASEAENRLQEALFRSREDDRHSGRSGYGVHRSDLQVIHREKACPAALCSTGEQKALMLSLILAVARARAARFGEPPLLLLDEVVAHLDASRRAALFEEIRGLNAQAWMTGTDHGLFAAMLPHAQLLTVEQGKITQG